MVTIIPAKHLHISIQKVCLSVSPFVISVQLIKCSESQVQFSSGHLDLSSIQSPLFAFK